MFVSTQNAHKTQVSQNTVLYNNLALFYVYFMLQHLAAAAIGVPANKVLTRVKRLGMIYVLIQVAKLCYYI